MTAVWLTGWRDVLQKGAEQKNEKKQNEENRETEIRLKKVTGKLKEIAKEGGGA